MSVSREDFLDAILFASHLAKVDSAFSILVEKALIDLVKSVGISKEEMEGLRQKISLEAALNELESVDSKEMLVEVLYFIASTDGVIQDDENNFIDRVIKRLKLNPGQFSFFLNIEQIDE